MAEIGFLMRGEIIWNKAASASPSTAWGSWQSPANPTLRDVHEYISIFSKAGFSRQNPEKRRATISREEFLELTKSVWTFPAVSARSIGHPAPFPVALPYRLIQLYTYEGDLVLDPFMGSGSTAIAALQANRHYLGYEIESHTSAWRKRRIQADSSLRKFRNRLQPAWTFVWLGVCLTSQSIEAQMNRVAIMPRDAGGQYDHPYVGLRCCRSRSLTTSKFTGKLYRHGQNRH